MKKILNIMLPVALLSCGASTPKSQSMQASSVYDFTMKNIDGRDVSLSTYKDKVLLIVNVASECGNTPQYEDLQKLYETYHDKGLEILGFPANNFMGQEPGTDADIKAFCTATYHVSFPMFSKISVKGDDMHPLYQYLTSKEQNGVIENEISWNFEKVLIDKTGKVVTHFEPRIKPMDATIVTAIDEQLAR